MSTIQVAGFTFPSFNSTEGIAVDLYLSGCARSPKCEGCHNPLLWDFSYGRAMELDEIIKELLYKYKDSDSIAIMGGEPVNQPNIKLLLERIYSVFGGVKSIWLYTSYELNEVKKLLKYVDYIKTGRFDSNKICKGRLGSSNQQIWRKEVKEGKETFNLFYGGNCIQ